MAHGDFMTSTTKLATLTKNLTERQHDWPTTSLQMMAHYTAEDISRTHHIRTSFLAAIKISLLLGRLQDLLPCRLV